MRTTKTLSLILSLGALVQAQTVNLTGKITTQAGKAIANAIVTLTPMGMKDTTGADGMYSLTMGNTAILPSMYQNANSMNFRNGVLEINLGRSASVKVDVFDTKGARLNSEAFQNTASGIYRMDFAKMALGTGICLIKVSVDQSTTTFRYAPMSGSKSGLLGSSNFMSQGASLARVAAVTDSIKVTASGYKPKSVVATSLTSTINVSLDVMSGGWTKEGYPFKNAPVASTGCGSASTIKSGTFNMTSASLNRRYIVNVPSKYDPNKPSRLVFGMHWMNGSDKAVSTDLGGWYGMLPLDTAKTTIWVAPQGYTDGSPWRRDNKDHIFFDDLLKEILGHACIDSTRIFSAGWSFGSMFTNSLSQNHQRILRGVMVYSTSLRNIYQPINNGDPIAWWGMVGLSDDLCPPADGRAARNIPLKNNKCTIPGTVPETTKGSGSHVTYEYQGCGNHPVVWSTFDGGHIYNPVDRGASATWMPASCWKFINQF